MGKQVPPNLRAFLLCREIATDLQSKAYSLIKIFDGITGFALPFAQEMCLYVAASGGHGTVPVDVIMTDPQGTKLWSFMGKLEFKNPAGLGQLCIGFTTTFSMVGHHTFELCFCGEPVAYHTLNVALAREEA